MDLSIDKIHHALLDASLPSTIEELKNPTEAYVVKLLTAFLSRFNIDVNLIIQPTPEQLGVMPYYEDSNISLINLHAAVKPIFDRIFLHDFCLTDITSPGSKRLRKQAKFISNFILYTMHKKSEFNERMDQIQAKAKLIEELKERKDQILETIKNKVMHKAKQSAMMEKLENDIQHTQLRMEKINKKRVELEATKNDVEMENQKVKELYGSLKTKAGKLSKMITEVQSEIVNSPEEYQSRLDEIKKQYKLKVKERDELQEAIQDKKQSIKQIGEKLNFVQKITADFQMLMDVYEDLSNKKEKLNDIRKEINSLNNELEKSKIKLATHKDQVNIEKNKLQTYHEENIIPLHNLHSQLLSEKIIQKSKLHKTRDCFNEKCLKRDKLQAEINKTEEEIMAFINNCQEAYNNEIANEIELRKILQED